MKQIPLTKNKFTLIDDHDFEIVNQYKWHFHSKGYAARKPRTGNIFLHRVLLNVKKGQQVDHINGDKLDNRRVNLRVVTSQGNQANSKISKNNKAGYKGVVELKDKPRNKRFASYIKLNYKSIYLGLFSTKEEAASAYNEAAQKHFGEFARLNTL